MYFAQAIQLVIVLIAITFVTPNQAIQCFFCMGKEDCQNPRLMECNDSLLTETENFIRKVHRIEPIQSATQGIECLHETLNYRYGRFDYMGCNSAINQVCNTLHTDETMPDYTCEVTNGDDNGNNSSHYLTTENYYATHLPSTDYWNYETSSYN